MKVFTNFQHVTVAVSDVERALAFYRDLLGFPVLGRLRYDNPERLVIDFLDIGNQNILEIFSFLTPTRPTDWIANDLQVGYRHVGFNVDDVDAIAVKLKAAGVPFTMDPLDAKGGVRIAFFKDPDGTLLEICQGELQLDKRIADAPGNGAAGSQLIGRDKLVLDHIAITVPDLERSLHFYRDQLGGKVRGQLFFDDDRGFQITYVQLGSASVELFTYAAPTIPRRWDPDNRVLGWKHMGLLVDDVDVAMQQVTAAGVPVLYPAVDALGNVRTGWVKDPDGYPVEFIDGTCDYQE